MENHTEYRIHPSIGIARIGNADPRYKIKEGEKVIDCGVGFYLAPTGIGERPIECDEFGNESIENGKPKPVEKFKDGCGRAKRQAAKFKIFKYDTDNPADEGTEVRIGNEITSITWKVHLANKKSAWYNFSEFQGDTMWGDWNSYKEQNVPLRNQDAENRQSLIIDPGPRTLTYNASKQENKIKKCFTNGKDKYYGDQDFAKYPHGKFPHTTSNGQEITYLGEIFADNNNNLVVLGGFGYAGGDQPITSFGGGDTWYDDISDGPVTCELVFSDGSSTTLEAWVIVCPIRYAPEIVNITSLDDNMFDVGVRYMDLVPEMYKKKKCTIPGDQKGWVDSYVANFKRDIAPIMKRLGAYRWIANVPSMIAFAYPPFDIKDKSDSNMQNRKNYFSYFRNPGNLPEKDPGQHSDLYSPNKIPLIPVNSGSNSITQEGVDKFSSLTSTQYFLLQQWSEGKFTLDEPKNEGKIRIHSLDHASVGSCAGSPMSPGVEVTWTTRNPDLYSEPYHIKHRKNEDAPYDYDKNGLDHDRDEAQKGGIGCEPGDLTKRMAIPWQADLFECNVEQINYSKSEINQDSDGIPIPPTYYVYWWPPQCPWDVISGEEENQKLAGIPAGLQVNFARGINSHDQMILAWGHLGFIVNQNDGPDRDDYPYFVETERNHEMFEISSQAVDDVTQILNPDDTTFRPSYYVKRDKIKGDNIIGVTGT